MRRFFAIGKGRVIARRASIVTLVLSVVCGATGAGLVVFDVVSSTGSTVASATTPPPGPTLSLPPGGTQVLGLEINRPPAGTNSSSSSTGSSSSGTASGSANQSGAQNAAPLVTPPPTPPPSHGTDARSILTFDRDQLNLQIPGISDKDNKKRAQDARDALNDALVAALWTDGNHVVDKTANKVFDNVKQAVQKLSEIKNPPSWVQPLINDAEYAARLLAAVMISENTCTPDKSKELDAANKELAQGDDEYNKTHYPQAIDHYKNARDHAQKAKGDSCTGTPGFVVTPTGALFSLAGMVPKDSTTANVIVQVTGTAGPVTLNEANVSATAITNYLQLTVHDNTTGVDLYGPNAPLGSMALTNVCGTSAGVCPSWVAGEQHSFTLTVRFPSGSGDNAYQGMNALLDLVWTRN